MTPEEQTQVQEPEGGGRSWRTGFRGREALAEGELTAKRPRRTLLQEEPEHGLRRRHRKMGPPGSARGH